MSYRVVITDHSFTDLDIERGILDEIDADLVDATATDRALETIVADANGVLVMYAEVDEDLIAVMTDCKVISRTGIGVDNVDIDAATERGIAVTNVPDYCIPEVSDHTVALLLALERNVVTYHDKTMAGEWDIAAGRPMHRLEGQTLGLVAFGNIAMKVAEKASALGLDVQAFDPYLDDEVIEANGVTPVTELDELLAVADIVSIHTPLTAETEGMFGQAQFQQMNKSAFLINVARGGIINEQALSDALAAGEIAGAALDVVAEEPIQPDHPLLARDNLILTPHVAWNSEESVVELREKAARNVRDVLRGDLPDYLVNTDVIQ